MAIAETPLLPFADEIWIKRVPLRFFGLQIGTRMSVIRLRDGGLFVHSPVVATAETRAAVDVLGAVRFVVAPNRLHHLFVGDWFAAYPAARIFCAKELVRKRADLPWHGALDDAPEPEWAAEIDQALFRGNRFMEEAIFLHRRSRTLIVTDLLESAHREDGWLERVAARIGGVYERPGLTHDQRLMVRDRPAARAAARRILAWDFERIVLAHGQLIERDGKSVFRAAMRWLGV